MMEKTRSIRGSGRVEGNQNTTRRMLWKGLLESKLTSVVILEVVQDLLGMMKGFG